MSLPDKTLMPETAIMRKLEEFQADAKLRSHQFGTSSYVSLTPISELKQMAALQAENAALRQQLATARNVLKSVERDRAGICPICLSALDHAPDCRLAAIIAKMEK